MSDTHDAECGNCNWKGPLESLGEPRDLWSRLEPGDEVPAGDCPKCESFAYLTNGRFTKIARERSELLYVCREVISQIDQGGGTGKIFSRDAVIAAARKAVAKAEGRT